MDAIESPLNVVDISADRMARILESAQPYELRIPSSVLAKLRAYQQEQRLLLEGCAAGLGIDPTHWHAHFDLDAGVVQVRPVA